MKLSFQDRISMFNTNTKKEDDKKLNKISYKAGQNKKEGNNGKEKLKVPDISAKKIDNKIVDENKPTPKENKNKITPNVNSEKNSNNKKNESNFVFPKLKSIKEQNGKDSKNKMENGNINKNVELKKNIPKVTNGSKILKTENQLDTNELKIGKLINGKHPIYGSKKVSEIKGKNNTLQLYDYPLNIEYSSKEETISILFVGQSGTGKSTFINAYINHLLGITNKDNIRYKLIFGDKSKENDQTKSQTDIITIYNIRSPKYNNKLFKLIDTPGAGDTRNDNEQQISKIDQDKKEKEFLTMYTNLFSKEIGQLNSITFVVKSSENRENEFQRKIIKSITNLFAGDVGQNCLAILTHTDNDEIIPDAVQLLEKMDIFKKKNKNNEEWYFPVSSTSYFTPFKIGMPSVAESLFKFTESSFIKYTKKILSLNLYYTKQTKKNLELKEQQEKIIRILKDNILDNLLNKIKELKDNEINLNQKMKECENKEKEIEGIKNQIEQENKIRNEIDQNYKLYTSLKEQKEKDLKENNDRLNSLTDKKNTIEIEIGNLDNKKKQAENEKKEAEDKQQKLKEEIDKIEKAIQDTENNITNKKAENVETEEMKKIKEELEKSKATINDLENQLKTGKTEEEINKIKKDIEEKNNNINNLESIIKNKDNEETKNMQKLKEILEQKKNECDILNNKIIKINQEKEEYENQKKKAEDSINSLTDQISNSKKEKEELEKQLEDEKRKYQEELNINQNSLNAEKEKRIKEIQDRETKLNSLENDIKKQIEMKQNEINTKIKIEFKTLTKCTKTYLICKYCKRNCHEDCDCNWALFWEPIFACHKIQGDSCITCFHPKKHHQRDKQYYKDDHKYESISSDKREELEKEILDLEESLKENEKIKVYFREEIKNIENKYNIEKNRKEEELEYIYKNNISKKNEILIKKAEQIEKDKKEKERLEKEKELKIKELQKLEEKNEEIQKDKEKKKSIRKRERR